MKNIKKCALIAAALAASVSATAQTTLSDNIVIDQFGYLPNARKIAVIRSPQNCTVEIAEKWNPTITSMVCNPGVPFSPGPSIAVIDDETGETVFSGAATAFRGGAIDSASGDLVWHFDFSSVTTPGRYYIQTNNIRSYTFSIDEHVYNDVLKHAVRMLYYQRAGTAKPAQYAGAGWADAMAFAQDANTRDFFDSTNVERERNLIGGWFDAGDYNKYTKWAADYISLIIHIYEEKPEVFTDNYGIPESGNGIPDIIDEMKWGLAWLLRMQNEDGSVLSVQGLHHASPPSAATGISYYGPASATATFASATAYAIAARFFKDNPSYGDAGFADVLEEAALKAWQWGIAHPDSMFFNNSEAHGSQGLASGQQEQTSAWDRLETRITAAWYLYELTSEQSYLDYVEAAFGTDSPLPLFAWSNFMDQYRHSQHMLYMRYLESSSGDAAVKNRVRQAMTTAFNSASGNFHGRYNSDGYMSYITQYNWGSNEYKSNYGVTYYKWPIVEPTVNANDFKNMAAGYLHYLHGVNPFNMVYLTGARRFGASRGLTSIYHAWFDEHSTRWGIDDGTNPGPAPGYLSGGANIAFTIDACCPSGCGAYGNARCAIVPVPENLPPAKMYADINHTWPVNTWEITEPMIAYQLAYIRLLSKFATSQGPSTSIAGRGGYGTTTARTAQARPHVSMRGRVLSVSPVQGGGELRVRVIDVRGRVRADFTSSGNSRETFSLRRIPAGRYFVDVRGADGVRQVTPIVVR